SDIVEYPLRARLSFEEKDGRIIGDLKYFYGMYEVNPFSDDEERDVYIIRDDKKETLVMNLIEQANFRYNGVNIYLEITEDEALYDFLYNILQRLKDELELFLSSAIIELLTVEAQELDTNVDDDILNYICELVFV